MGSLLGMVLLGVLIGGVDVVDRVEDRLWFIPQALAGPIVFVADYANQSLMKTGKVGEIIAVDTVNGGDRRTRPPQGPEFPSDQISASVRPINRLRSVGRVHEIGTLYIALAGLLNLAAMLDAATRAPGEPKFVTERRGRS